MSAAPAATQPFANGGAPHPLIPFQPIGRALEGVQARPEYVWEGYLARGAVTLLSGVPKGGKSTLSFAAIGAIARGEAFLGFATERAGALILSEERGSSIVEKHDRWLCGGLEPHLLQRHQMSASWADTIRAAVAYCKAEGLRLLVVDTWTAWAGLKADFENHAGAVAEALQPLQLAAAQGLAVLVIVHRRKSGGDYGEAVRGSNALVAGADVVVELERPYGLPVTASHRMLRAQSRYPDTPAELLVELTAEGYVDKGTVAETRQANEQARLLECLSSHIEIDRDESHSGLTAAELAEGVGMGKAKATKLLNQLHAEGKLSREGSGRKGSPYLYGCLSTQSKSKSDESHFGGES